MGLTGLCRLCAGIHLTDFYLRPFQVPGMSSRAGLASPLKQEAAYERHSEALVQFVNGKVYYKLANNLHLLPEYQNSFWMMSYAYMEFE